MSECKACEQLKLKIAKTEKELKSAEKKLKQAKRTLKAVGDNCADVSKSNADFLSTGNHPRGSWSFLRGQADQADTILRMLDRPAEIRQIRRRTAPLLGKKLFSGFRRLL